ncbi:MAG: hypothetical protein LBD99_03405 [Candidatus Margulisbacteria bacterium]|jgi:hypothetical protein|nr:hypothetical protein [Candidatus Margulisiibacteriota bacterium]
MKSQKFLLLVLCLMSAATAAWNGNRWSDEKYNFTFEIPGSWQIDPDSKRRVYANRGDGVTEFYVEVVPAKQRDAEIVAKENLKAYDSWRYIAGRHLNGGERRGAETAFGVMFSRSMLQRATARAVLILAQEGYYVKGDNAIIVTLITDSDAWSAAKKELLAIWNSFRAQ